MQGTCLHRDKTNWCHRLSSKELSGGETKPPHWKSLNRDLIIVRGCLILAYPFEVIPGLHTLTQTQIHTLKKDEATHTQTSGWP